MDKIIEEKIAHLSEEEKSAIRIIDDLIELAVAEFVLNDGAKRIDDFINNLGISEVNEK